MRSVPEHRWQSVFRRKLHNAVPMTSDEAARQNLESACLSRNGCFECTLEIAGVPHLKRLNLQPQYRSGDFYLFKALGGTLVRRIPEHADAGEPGQGLL